MKKHILRTFTLALVACFLLALQGCKKYSEENATLVCGVPVKGTPWELATAIAEHGNNRFEPECVLVFKEKAYISGAFFPLNAEDYPAEIICDLNSKGQVTHAWFDTDNLDEE